MGRLSVNLCGIELDNPVIPASGTFGYGYEYADPVNHRDKETYLLPTERSWHFQIGAELSYQYFLPCTSYRLGFGASYELSYSNYNPQQTIGMLNLNVSWKLFNF